MADFNEQVKKDNNAEKLFLTIRDGIYLIRTRSTETIYILINRESNTDGLKGIETAYAS